MSSEIAQHKNGQPEASHQFAVHRNGNGGSSSHRAAVLVVEDDVIHRTVVSHWLNKAGHNVTCVETGEAALDAIKANAPDLVLLDIQMPGISGIDVLERVREHHDLMSLPIIMTTSLSGSQEIAHALDSGANDYVTKPLDGRVILARVNSQLNLRARTHEVLKMRNQLAEQYERLAELDGMKESLMQMVVHDLRNPLTSILGYVELTKREEAKEKGDPYRFLPAIEAGCSTLLQMVTGMLDLTKLEAGTMELKLEPVALGPLLEEVHDCLGGHAQEKSLSISVDIGSDAASVNADREILRRVFVNILDNAVRVSPRGGSISVRSARSGGDVRVEIEDEGPGIPQEAHARVFEKFGQVEMWREEDRPSTGLGLTFCKMAVEAHNGSIGLESEPGHGCTFWFTIPE